MRDRIGKAARVEEKVLTKEQKAAQRSKAGMNLPCTRSFIRTLAIGFFLVCLRGCGLRQEPIFDTTISLPPAPIYEHPRLSAGEQARIHDIPFPLQVQPRKLLLTESQMVISYTSYLTQEELSAFYHTGMDYWGWEELGIVRSDESCLMFAKPSKLCTIVLRSKGTETYVVLFTTLRS